MLVIPLKHVDNMVHMSVKLGEIRGVPECNTEGGFFSSSLFWKRGVGEEFSFLDFHHIRNTCLSRRAKASKHLSRTWEGDVPESDSKSAVSGHERSGRGDRSFT